MTKVNVKNERTKRRFFTWLKEAEGCCDSTIDNVENAIFRYEDFTKQADFTAFNPDKAVNFKKWLAKREFRGKRLSLTTYHSYLRYLQKFFTWLSWQPGYKSKITPDLVCYLKISEKEERIATQCAPRRYPALEYVVKLADSITINSEIDRRDRALISFTLLSGMRDKAIVTLPLGCFDEESLTINQNPKQGVQTKFSKFIPSTLFRFDDKLASYVIEWVKHLRTKAFGSQDPLFPRSKIEHGEDNLSFEPAREVEPIFWRGTGMIRQIFKNRSKDAGLPYHPPNTFRHLAVDLAFKHCETGEQMKAVSQNFGHEHIATTFSSYANYDPQRLHEILKNLNFSKKPPKTDDEKIEKIKKILLDN
ncbi:MAG: site-specific integrase [Candidatus Zixiibacteriota bacterium]